MADIFDAFGNGYWNPIDFILPGTSALTTGANRLFDMNGQQAANAQYNSQLALNQQTQLFNAQQAAAQRQWEERMDNTSIQRRVADIKAAGLNPWLALQGSLAGAGAPSGSSASASSGSADMANNKIAAAAGIIAVMLRAFLTKH